MDLGNSKIHKNNEHTWAIQGFIKTMNFKFIKLMNTLELKGS